MAIGRGLSVLVAAPLGEAHPGGEVSTGKLGLGLPAPMKRCVPLSGSGHVLVTHLDRLARGPCLNVDISSDLIISHGPIFTHLVTIGN